MVLVCRVVCSFGGGVSWCPLVQRCAGVRGFRTCHRLALVLWWCAPCLLSALLHCACRVACKYGSISHFKGVLRGVLWCGCMFIWVWGFAWIVWLLCAWGVWRLYDLMRVCLSFCPLCSCFYLFSCFPRLVLLAAWLLILVLSSLSLWVVVVSFSLTDVCAKRKGAKCCSLRPLSVFCSVVQILVTLSKNSVAVALAFSSSFGLYSQLIQQESEGLPVLTLIRSGIMSI